MPRLGDLLTDVERLLAEHYGHSAATTAGDSTIEAVVRAVVSRFADTRRTTSLIDSLRDAGVLDAEQLATIDRGELIEIAKQSSRSDAARWINPLVRVARWHATHASTLDELPTARIREELLALPGVGPATADAVLLEAFGRPVYPLDRGTYRILVRHGWVDPGADYDEARSAIEGPVGDDAARLGRLSLWLVRVGSDFCRATTPRCERCPLRSLLNESGPIEPDPGEG